MAVETEQDDSIRGLLEGAMAGTTTADPPPPIPDLDTPALEPPANETAEQKAERARDEQGRFAKAEKARETLTLKPVEKAIDPTQQPAPLVKPIDPAAPRTVAAPPWFKGAGKVDWNKMPDPVRAELSEFVKGLEVERAEVAPLKEMIDQARPLLVREAGSVAEGVRQLLAFHQLSVDKPVELIQHIARSRGIDLRALLGGQPVQQNGSQPQQQQPDIQALIAQTVQRELQPYKAQIEQRETQQYVQTIEEFRDDPAHPYFNEVSQHMGWLLKSGQAKDMQDAYDQATRAHPVIWQALSKQQAEEAAKTKAAEVAKAQQANRASLTGSPVHGAVSQMGESDGSIRGDLMRSLKAHTGAV